jgi:putative redox protein
VVTVGAPFDPTHVETSYDACLDQVFAEGSGQWMAGGKTLTLKGAFVVGCEQAKLHDKIKGLKLPLLILHSPTDNTVGIQKPAISSAPPGIHAASSRWRVLSICSPAPVRQSAPAASSGSWADAYLR